jgi:hypothetical protein
MDAHEIMRFMTAEEHDEKVKDAIAFAMEGIQSSMVVARLPEELRTIMNMWARTEWYDFDGEAKFERCLWKVVALEMQKRVFAFLVERSREEMYQMPDEDDLYHALTQVMNGLACLGCIEEYWPTLGAELADEADRWLTEYEERSLIEYCDGGRFQYYDCVNEEVCYHMPHRPKPVEYEEEAYEDKETGEKEEEEETGWV